MTSRDVTGLTWEESSGQPTVHTFARKPLNVRPGSFSRVYSFTAESGAMSSRRVGSGRAMVAMTIRFDRSSKHLAEMLRHMKGGKVTFWRRAPAIESYPSRLVETGDVTWVEPDGARYGYGEYQLDIVLRAQSSTLSYEPLYSPWFLRWKHGESIRRFTYSRASTAFFVDGAKVGQEAASGVARLQHYVTANDGETYATTLLEPGATNLLTRSEEFDHADWSTLRLTVAADDAVAPDGETTADKLVESVDDDSHLIEQTVTVTSGVTAALSLHCAPGERGWIRLQFSDTTVSNGVRAWFNLSTGTVGTSETFGTGATLARAYFDPEALARGWLRPVIVGAVAGETSYRMRAYLATANEELGYNGDGASGLYIWGAQVEEGQVASSYIPTTSSTADREPDNLYALVDPNVVDDRVVYVDWIELGTAYIGSTERYIHIGAADNSSPRFLLSSNATDGRLFQRLGNAAGDNSDISVTVISDVGDRVRALPGWEISEDGAEIRATLSTKVNDGDWTTQTPGSWIALDFSKWSLDSGEDQARLWFNSVSTGSVGRMGLRIAALFDRTLTATQAERIASG